VSALETDVFGNKSDQMETLTRCAEWSQFVVSYFQICFFKVNVTARMEGRTFVNVDVRTLATLLAHSSLNLLQRQCPPEGTSTITPAQILDRLQQLSKLVEIWWWNRRRRQGGIDRVDCLSEWLPGLPVISPFYPRAPCPVAGLAGGLRRLWLQTSMSSSWAKI